MASASSSGGSGFALVRQTRSTGAQTEHDLEVVRGISADEYDFVTAARVFVARMGNHSEFANLSGYVQDFRDAVRDQMVAMVTDSQQAIDAFPRTARRFADTLHAFGSFIDRNSAWLSACKSDHPNALTEFQGKANEEFDSNAAYRVFVGLRNVSTHASQVINKATIEGQIVAKDVSARTLVLSIDGPKLVEDHGGRLTASRKAALLDAPGPIHVVPCVENVVQSCRRLHARLCLSMLDTFQEACETLEALRNQACAGSADARAWVMMHPRPDAPLEGMVPVDEHPWAELLEVHPERWRAALEEEGTHVTIEELCHQPDLTMYRRKDGTPVDPDDLPPFPDPQPGH